MLCVVEIVNTPPFRRPLERGDGWLRDGSIPLLFKAFPFQGGVAAPLIKRSRSLAAQTGWFVISNKIRIATRAYTEATRLFTNHPRPLRGLPSFERRGIDSLQQLSSNRAQACA